MNDNPEGTPNPLNPGFGSGTMAAGAGEPEAPVSTGDAGAPATEAPEPTIDTSTPTAGTPEVSAPKPHKNHTVMDPMMRPVSHQSQHDSNFDTLEMEDVSIEELATDTPIGTPIDTPASPLTAPASFASTDTSTDHSKFVAKDSIVEPSAKKGGKKKALIIGAIVLIMIAIICGAAAIAIVFINNNGDKVTKAIDKLLDGNVPSILSAQGNITTTPNDDNSFSTSIDFNGAIDFATKTNKVTAEATATFPNDATAVIDINELRTRDGNTYFKISGLDSVLNATNSTATVQNAEVVSTGETVKCIGSDDTKCLTTTETEVAVTEPTSLTTETGLLSIFSGLIDSVDDQWILIPDSFEGSMESLEIFDNSSTCLINAFSNLPTYGKDLAAKYRANPFITYSTDKPEIVKVKNDLYRLGVNEDKMAAFINSLSGNGFINDLNACVGNTATNTGISASSIKDIFNGFPTVYVEIDDNYSFTRAYFRATTGDETLTTTTADLSLSYPSKIEIDEPTEYINMSNLLNRVMTGVLSGGESSTDQ